MRKREPELDAYVGTNCPLVSMLTPTGKHRKTLAANAEHLFRIIQSIPSKKAEPFKRWMAEVAAQRLEQMQDPKGFTQSAKVAKKGGSVAKAADYLPPVDDVPQIENAED